MVLAQGLHYHLLKNFFSKDVQSQINLYCRLMTPKKNEIGRYVSALGLCGRHAAIMNNLANQEGFKGSIWSDYQSFRWLVVNLLNDDLLKLIDRDKRDSFLSGVGIYWFNDSAKRVKFVRGLKKRLREVYL